MVEVALGVGLGVGPEERGGSGVKQAGEGWGRRVMLVYALQSAE